MTVFIDELIAEHREELVDSIAKGAIELIPSYSSAPLLKTVGRVDRWLEALSVSIAHNEPGILESYLVGVAEVRDGEGYSIDELHAIVQITQHEIEQLVTRTCGDEVDCNANLALLAAVMDAARMVLSVQYILRAGIGSST